MYDNDFYDVNKKGTMYRNSSFSGAGGLPAATDNEVERSDRLEYNSNNLENKFPPFTRINVVPHRCDSRVCPECGKRKGYQTRKILCSPENLEKFSKPALLTFTIDPKKNPNPLEVYNLVRNKSLIQALMKMLHIKYWVWVLEFQKNGNPHWHIIADISERGRITKAELKKIWHLWNHKWNIGGCDVQENKAVKKPIHAMHYITKYLINPKKNSYPEWFLSLKNVRIIQGSRAVGKLTPYQNSSCSINPFPKTQSSVLPLLDRLKACGQSVVVVAERILKDGKSIYLHCGEIPLSLDNIRQINKFSELSFVVYFQDIKRLGYTKVGAVLGCINLASPIDKIRESVANVSSYLACHSISNASYSTII